MKNNEHNPADLRRIAQLEKELTEAKFAALSSKRDRERLLQAVRPEFRHLMEFMAFTIHALASNVFEVDSYARKEAIEKLVAKHRDELSRALKAKPAKKAA